MSSFYSFRYCRRRRLFPESRWVRSRKRRRTDRSRGHASSLKLRFDSSLIDDGPCRFDFPLVELVKHVLRKGYLAPINLKAEETSLGRAVKSQAARDVRRLADQEVNVEMKVRDFTKIPLQHFAITRQPERFAVVVHFVMNELFQLSPILPVETVDIFAVDGGKTGVSQSTCLRRGGSFRPFVAAERSASWVACPLPIHIS